MTDSKSNDKRDKLDADLDSKLNEVQFPQSSADEFQDDEDAIDRLLKNAGFDSDQDVGSENEPELLDSISFDNSKDDSNNPELNQQASPPIAGSKDGNVDQAENELQDDEDALDRLLMTVGFDDDYDLEQPIPKAESELEEQDDILDLNVKEPEILPEVDLAENPPDEEDQLDELFGLGNDFNELDMLEDDHSVESVPAMADLKTSEEAVDVDDNISHFSDFSDFAESDMILSDQAEVSDSTVATLPLASEDADVDDEFDYFSDLTDQDEGDKDISEMLDVAVDGPEQPFIADVSDKGDEFLGLGDDFDMGDISQGKDEESSVELFEDDSSVELFNEADYVDDDVVEETAQKKDEFVADEDFFKLDEVSDDFSKQIENQLAEAEKLSNQDKQEDDFLLPDFDISADFESTSTDKASENDENELDVFFSDTDFLNQEDAMQSGELEASGFTETVAEPAPKPASTVEAIEEVKKVKLSSPEFESEDFKKQLEEAKDSVKKTKLLVYVALGFAAVAVSAAVGLGVMTYSAKTEVSKLTETVSSLETSLAKIAEKNPDKEINAMVHSVVQLNQQVYGFISDLKGNAQLPVDLLDKKVADLVAKQDMVSKALAMLQVKMGDALDKVSIEPIALETHKPEVAQEPVVLAPTSVPVPAPAPAPAPEKEIAPVKTEAAHAQVKEAVDQLSSKKEALKEIATNKEKAKLETVPTKVETKPEASPTKPETKPETKSETKSEKAPSKVPVTSTPVKVKAEPEVVTAKPKPTVAPVAQIKPEPEKAKKQQASANWGVNLVAFKQEWFAKSKAAEFARQGIYAEVIPVQGNNSTLYRLRVGGFKNKAEATASKDRIKKILNLDSVWVSDN